MEDDTNSSRPSTASPFEEISFQMRTIRDFVSNLPWGRESIPPPVTPMLLNSTMRDTCEVPFLIGKILLVTK